MRTMKEQYRIQTLIPQFSLGLERCPQIFEMKSQQRRIPESMAERKVLGFAFPIVRQQLAKMRKQQQGTRPAPHRRGFSFSPKSSGKLLKDLSRGVIRYYDVLQRFCLLFEEQIWKGRSGGVSSQSQNSPADFQILLQNDPSPLPTSLYRKSPASVYTMAALQRTLTLPWLWLSL